MRAKPHIYTEKMTATEKDREREKKWLKSKSIFELSRVQGNKHATHRETHQLPYQVKWAWVVFKRIQNTKHFFWVVFMAFVLCNHKCRLNDLLMCWRLAKSILDFLFHVIIHIHKKMDKTKSISGWNSWTRIWLCIIFPFIKNCQFILKIAKIVY